MTLLLVALVAATPFAMDIYLPSMPAMTRALAATPGAARPMATAILAAAALAQRAGATGSVVRPIDYAWHLTYGRGVAGTRAGVAA